MFNADEDVIAFHNLVDNFFFSKFTPEKFHISMSMASQSKDIITNPGSKDIINVDSIVPFVLNDTTYSSIMDITNSLYQYIPLNLPEAFDAVNGMRIRVSFTAQGKIKEGNQQATLSIYHKEVLISAESIKEEAYSTSLAFSNLRERLAQLAICKTIYENEIKKVG